MTSRIELSGEAKPPEAIVWYMRATSIGVSATAPSDTDGSAGTSRCTPSRCTTSTTRSMPMSSPSRAVDWLYDCASARYSRTMP
ncbi:MAG: hypothetical protein CALGDGBN_03204 [Pseudomonadales bacterium]|nr:hypothetical protein [Pseudomonadales bacterium]